MATLSKGHTFSGGETVTAAKLNSLVDSATISNIVNADINASAAIALSKLATGALPAGITVASANLVDGTIVNADVNASAAIDLSKLATGALPTAITVASANLVNGTIVDADISSSAEIAVSKLADGAPRQLLQTDAAGTGVEWTSNVDVPGTLDVTGAAVLDSTLTVAGAAVLDSTLTVAGAATFNGSVTMGDADDIILATGTGTKIGTAVGQKLGFYNKTPVVQPAAAAQVAAAAQTQDAVTDSTGGTASTTLAAITAGAAYAQGDMTAVKNALASIASQLAKIRADVTNIKTLQDATRTALVDLGLIKGAA